MVKSKTDELGDLTVELTSDGKTTRVAGTLLGSAALVVESKQRPALQSEVEVSFQPRPGSPSIAAKGVVDGHIGNDRMRIKLTDISEKNRRHLLELLYPPGAERRTARRASLVTQIRTIVDEETLVGYTRDISTGGVFVETEQPPPKGTEVNLRFKLGPDSPILGARAVVAYSLAGDGMGLKFQDLPDEIRQAIEDFVQQQEEA